MLFRAATISGPAIFAFFFAHAEEGFTLISDLADVVRGHFFLEYQGGYYELILDPKEVFFALEAEQAPDGSLWVPLCDRSTGELLSWVRFRLDDAYAQRSRTLTALAHHVLSLLSETDHASAVPLAVC